jgi:hypothetical protein
MTIPKNLLYYTEKFVILYRKFCYTILKNLLYYTKKFIILYLIIHYSVNEFAYNESLISQDVEFVISRGTVYKNFKGCR